VLREKVRKYRSQAQELERQAGQRDRRVAVLEQEVARLAAAVQAGPRPEERAGAKAALRAQLEGAQRSLQSAEAHVRVLEKKADTDARQARQAAAAAQREKGALQKQVRGNGGLCLRPGWQRGCSSSAGLWGVVGAGW
jgi:hypothetical protein